MRLHKSKPPPKLIELPEPVQWVWVINRSSWSDRGCFGTRYALLKKNKGGGVTVVVRGYPRAIPKADNRHFFFDPESAWAYVRGIALKEHEQVVAREKRLSELLSLPEKELLDSIAQPESYKLPPPFKGKIKL